MTSEEVLENGYARTTPPGDNLAIDFVRDLAESYRRHAQHAGHATLVDDDHGVVLADNGSRSLFLNPAVLTRPLSEAGAAPFAERVAAFFAGRPGGPYAVWSFWPTPDLRPHGLVLAGHPPFMLREMGGRPAGMPSDLRIVTVDDDASAAAYEIALVNGFPVHELQPPQPGCFFAGDARQAPGWHHFVGFVGDEPVATASAYEGERVVRVDNVSTLPDRRGHGYGAALTWAATLVRPDLPAVLLASDDGRPVYQRMGYRSLSRAMLWIGTRAG
jgi:GNAT superfamily N-acetyltransferase